MEYNKFILTVFESIRSAREVSINQPIIANKLEQVSEPSNIFIQLIAEKSSKRRKIEQWSFESSKSIISSEYGESYDSELDEVEVQKKSFFISLEQILNQFEPKQLIRQFSAEKVYLHIKNQEQKLIPFANQSNYIVEIGDYETESFTSKVSLKMIKNQLSESDHLSLMDEQEEYQVLADPLFDVQVKHQKIIDINCSGKRQNTVGIYADEQQQQMEDRPGVEIDSSSTKYIEVREKPVDKRLAVMLQIEECIRRLDLSGMTLRALLKGE